MGGSEVHYRQIGMFSRKIQNAHFHKNRQLRSNWGSNALSESHFHIGSVLARIPEKFRNIPEKLRKISGTKFQDSGMIPEKFRNVPEKFRNRSWSFVQNYVISRTPERFRKNSGMLRNNSRIAPESSNFVPEISRSFSGVFRNFSGIRARTYPWQVKSDE